MKKWVNWFVVLLLTATSSPANFGNCLSLNGIDDYASISSQSTLYSFNGLTVEAWIKADRLDGRFTIFSADPRPGSTESFHLEVGTGDGGTNRVAVRSNAGWVVQTADNTIETNTWVHLAYVRYSDRSHVIFVNGIGQPYSATYYPTVISTNWTVGAEGSGAQYFNGCIDELRIWNAKRSPQQIWDSMCTPAIGNETGLIACYHFDESSGTLVPDATVNANHGILTGTTAENWQPSGAIFTPAVIITNPASSLTVDGHTASISLLGTNNAFTVGNLIWSNAANGAIGTQPIDGGAFQITGIPLDVDRNTITVTGTNALGVAAADTVEIDRSFIHTGESPIHYAAAGNPLAEWPYTNWITAAATIQDAVDAAATGDTVLVNDGDYQQGIRMAYGRSCPNRLVINRDIAVQSLNGPESTRILGAGSSESNAVRGVYMDAGTLSGFTVTSGCTPVAGNDVDISGGGVWCIDNSPIITNCIISGNSAYYGGGSAQGTLSHCTLSGNSADTGGGSHGGVLKNCTISNNTATNLGGGCYLSTAENCMLTSNSADTGGGCYESPLTHCTLTGNSARVGGGGYFYFHQFVIVENCIIWNNTAASSPNWYLPGYGIIFSCTDPLPQNRGNICADPRFRDKGNGDFRLLYGSPCIDTGTNTVGMVDDLEGNLRPLDGNFDSIGICDMGAYEYNPSTTDSDGDGRLDAAEWEMGWNPDFDEQRVIADTEAAVIENPAVYGLYTSNSIHDLSMGGLVAATSNGWIFLNLQLTQCTNLAEGAWFNIGDAVPWQVETIEGKAFFRIKAE